MQRSTLVLLSALAATVLFAPTPSRAAIGTLDNVPAATLLVPYFEVDLDDANGPQTRVSVFNAYDTAELTHVQFWSEWGNPTFGFDVYLGGRDTVEIDLGLVFKGVIPQTGPTLSGNGPHSNTNINFPGCPSAGSLVSAVSLPIPDLLDADQIAFLRNTHTGQPVPELGNRCMSRSHGDSVARGYVTIDTVNACSLLSPASPGYFVAGGNGIASNRNKLVGSFTVLERNNMQYPASPVVHIEASGTDPDTITPGSHTFYGTLVSALASDNREPLGAIWDARVYSSVALGGFNSTELIVWRDRGNTTQMTTGTNCGGMPPFFPLFQSEVASFDEAEQVDFLNDEFPYPNPTPPPEAPFALATQKVFAHEYFFPWEGGFSRLNLNTVVPGSPYGDDRLQSFVLVRHGFNGAAGAFYPATYVAGPQDPNVLIQW